MTDLISISDVRAKLPDLVNRVSRTFDRVVITVSGKPKAILLSAEELASLEETAEVLSIPGARQSIHTGLKQAKKRQDTLISKIK